MWTTNQRASGLGGVEERLKKYFNLDFLVFFLLDLVFVTIFLEGGKEAGGFSKEVVQATKKSAYHKRNQYYHNR